MELFLQLKIKDYVLIVGLFQLLHFLKAKWSEDKCLIIKLTWLNNFSFNVMRKVQDVMVDIWIPLWIWD